MSSAGIRTNSGGTQGVLTFGGSDVLTWDGSGNVTGVASINGGQLAGLRNRIINGGMAVDQRNGGAAQTITAGANPYTVDRFMVTCSGANITTQRVAGTGSNTYDLLLTGAASVTSCDVRQRIESLNSASLKNQNCAFSVELSSSALTSATWAVYYCNASDNFSANTLIASGTFTINSTPAKYTATFNAGANAGNGLSVIVSFGALLAAQTVRTSGWQLEIGSTATPFEQRPYGLELALCQRYYYETGTATTEVDVRGYASAASQAIGAIYKLPTTMRIAPISAVVGTWNVSNCGQPSFNVISKDTAYVFALSSAAGFTSWNNGAATTKLTFNAEL